MSKLIGLVFMTLLILSCHQKPNSNTDTTSGNNPVASTQPGNKTIKPPAQKRDSIKPIVRDDSPTENDMNRDSGYVESMDDTTITTKKIRYNLYDFHEVSIAGPFNLDSALIKLYPGNYYKLWKSFNDSVVFEAWYCKACPIHKFKQACEPDWEVTFPLPDKNETQIGDTILFIDSGGKRSIIISFQTTEFEEDFFGMGNGDGGFMGLALFTEENKGWKLKAFNPAVGCYGSYQTIPNIHPIRFGKDNFGCYIGNMSQGAGSPAYITTYLFGVFDHTFKNILVRDNTCRGNRDRNVWDAVIAVDSSKISNGFPDVLFTTEGDYSSTYIDPMDEGQDAIAAADIALKVIKPYIKHKSNFDFTIKSIYTFSGKNYKLVKENVSTRPHNKGSEKKGFTKYYYGKVGAWKFSRWEKDEN